ncbi:MAG: sugar phosphate isomerase/epimerase [Deltaproteobacteria bacterium]|nr:sugar phosphate isomerase/epimerase [Deltaproteobacteria bacterium]
MFKIYASSRMLHTLPLRKAVDRVAEAGYHGVEVWYEHFEESLDEGLERFIQEHPLSVILHGPGGDVNLASSNTGIRRESLLQYHHALELAERVGASIVVAHPGRRSSRTDPPEIFHQPMLDSLRSLAGRAAELGITLALEIMEKKEKELIVDPNSMNSILDSLGDGPVGVCFDVCHAFVNGDLLDQIRNTRNIIHFHLSDAAPGAYHLGLGEGSLDFQAIGRLMNEISPNLTATVEGRMRDDEWSLVARNAARLKEMGWL